MLAKLLLKQTPYEHAQGRENTLLSHAVHVTYERGGNSDRTASQRGEQPVLYTVVQHAEYYEKRHGTL
jgi:hypothetical protein